MLLNATVDKAAPTTKHYPARSVRSAEAEEARLVGLSAIYLKAHCVNRRVSVCEFTVIYALGVISLHWRTSASTWLSKPAP